MTNSASWCWSLISKRPWWVIASFALVAGFALTTGHFKIGHSYQDWIDREDPAYLDYLALRANFRDADTVQAAFALDRLTAATRGAYYALIERLRAAPGVLEVFEPAELLLGADAEQPPEADAIATLRERLATQPADYRNVLISKPVDALAPLILLDPAQSQIHPAVIEELRQGLTSLGFAPMLAGTAVFSATLKEAIAADLALVVVLLTATSAGLLWYFQRSVAALLSIALGVAIATLCAFALVGAWGLSVNLLTLLLVPLVFCMSLTTGIHLMARFAATPRDLREGYRQVWAPLVISTLTSAVSCLAFTRAPQEIVMRMGAVIAASVIFTFLCSMLLVPALWSVSNAQVLVPRRVGWTPGRTTRRILSIVLLALMGISAWQLPALRLEPDALHFFAADSQLVRDYRAIESRFTGLLVVDVMISSTDGAPLDRAPHLGSVQEFLRALRTIPELTAVVSGFDIAMLPDALGAAFFTPDHRHARLSLRFRNVDSRPFREISQAIGAAWMAAPRAELAMRVTGIIPLILSAQDRLLASQGTTLLAGLALICILLIPFFRSAKLLTLAALTIFSPLLVTLGVMAMADIAINSINLFVGSVILGLVVDDAIYLLHAYRVSGNIERALMEVGGALSLTTLCIGGAFATLAFTRLIPIRQFGLLSVVAVTTAWVCDLCVVPTLIELGERRR